MRTRYILEVREAPVEWLRDFVVEEVGHKAEEAYMTAADMLRQEGVEKGRAEGRAELVIKLLSLRFGPLSAELPGRVQGASIGEPDRWAERVLDARGIEEVFREA